MLGIHEIWLFVLSGVLLNITPGPDTVYVIGRSMQMGWRGGAAAALRHQLRLLFPRRGRSDRPFGAADGLIHRVLDPEAGRRGLSRSDRAANAVVAPGAGAGHRRAERSSLRRVFLQGVFTNALNPKVALFFLAFLPQFVAADAPHKPLAFLTLGLIFICTGTLWCLVLAAFAAKAAHRLRQSEGAIAWVNRALGGLFIYLGIRVAMLETR